MKVAWLAVSVMFLSSCVASGDAPHPLVARNAGAAPAHFERFRIGTLKLCEKVQGFRRYVEDLSARIKPGGVALIYLEPEQFRLRKAQDQYELHLTYQWRLYTEGLSEIKVERWENAAQSDRQDLLRFKEPIREFHQVFLMPIPPNLAAGHYKIKVTVRDAGQDRSDSRYLPFTVPGLMGEANEIEEKE